MKGLEISKAYYEQFGLPMLREQFPDKLDRLAFGLVGEGSECFGYDDTVSLDHDFEAGFCIFLTQKDEEEFGFQLSRAYSKLPKEFMGLKRGILSPVGGNRRGVITIEEFYTKFLGSANLPENQKQWLYIPSHSLACATNGEVFTDNLGEFSRIRNQLLKGYPEDIRRKKLAGNTILMAQSGQYNYPRCIARGERGAGQLAIFEFVKNAISTIYLLNNKYEPFYKWAYRGLRDLSILGDLAPSLELLTELDNSKENAKNKQELIEEICAMITTEYENQSLTKATCGDLEKHAFSILDGVKDGNLRNMHIMEGI